jgi:uncharacterized membrane protein
MNTKKLLLIIILFALLLRFWGIGFESYWIDEALIVRRAQEPFLKSMELVKDDVHLPVYTILLNGWVYLFGTTEIATRSLSLIFGVISIYIIFLLGKRLFNEKTGIYSSILLTVSAISIYYSQETRPYTLFILLTMLSFYFYLSLLEKNNWKNKILYFIPSLLMIYTHLFSFLSLFVQNVYYILKNWKNKKNLVHWISLQAVLGILFLPWISILLRQSKKITHLSWISINFMKIYYTFFDFFNHIIIFLLFIGLLIYVLKKYPIKKEKNNLILLGVWALLPIITVIVYSLFFTSLYQTRYLLLTLPAFYILFAWSISKLPKKYAVSILAVIVILSLSFVSIQQQSIDKDDWKAATLFIRNNVKENEYVFIHPYYHQYAFSYYFDKECFDAGDFYSCNFHEHNVLSLNWLADCCNDSTKLTSTVYEENQLKYYVDNNIWLINVRPEMYYQNNNLYDYFNEKKNLTFSKEFSGIEIYKFT